MEIKKLIWDFFKQKEDLNDQNVIEKIAHSIGDLNRRVHYLEQYVKTIENHTTSLDDLKNEIESINKKISDMNYIYTRKLEEINKKL